MVRHSRYTLYNVLRGAQGTAFQEYTIQGARGTAFQGAVAGGILYVLQVGQFMLCPV
jgi:hypothetical protein